jgi:glycogen debranching enzyme GlgX/4-alpha-glucanotransferase
MSDHAVSAGTAEPLGVHVDAAGVNVAVFSAHAEAIVFCLFDSEDAEVARIALPARTGDVFHGHVSGVGAAARYGLRAFGPWDPRRGHRFNPTKLLLDPFAVAIDRGFRLDPTLFDGDAPNSADSAPVMPKALVVADETAVPARAPFAWDRQVIYELHVRGFTMRHPDIPPALRGRFAALGHPAAIEHLRRLGVTAVELMPSAAWIDERHLPPLELSNYWGYNPVALLAPDPRLAPGGWAEVRAAVGALQAAGIAVLLDVVLNHLGESDHLGPTLSLRGLDNASYYRLRPDDPSRYVDDTGCGNTLALDRPPVLRLAMAALRGWVRRAGVDGFRFDLATTLARRAGWSGPGGSGRLGSSLGGADTGGFDPAAPLLTAIGQDPLLRDRALIAEPWDVGPGGYRHGEFPASWGEWNDRYRDTVRRFWRGDGGMLGALATRFAGSADVLAPLHRPVTRSVNFVTSHDGFTLADLVAYTAKRNAANGEANRDGTDSNWSWNNGVEGPGDDPNLRAARGRDVRALLATLLLSRGTPMLTMGDECGRSQGGNNNAYAQDNVVSWLDWTTADGALIDFVARLVRARNECAALTGGLPLTGLDVDASLIPDVVWRRPDGRALTPEDWQHPDHRTLVAALYAPDSRALVVLHAGQSPIEVTLPATRAGQAWRCALDSAAPDRCGTVAHPFAVAGRSVVLLVEAAGGARGRHHATDDALHQLAREAGIAASWWNIAGQEHRVGADTTRALLAAMRLPAATPGDIADSMARLAAVHARALPQSLVVRAGAPVTVVLGPLGATAHGGWLTLRREDAGEARFPLVPNAPRHLVLPPQPIGRHLLWLEGLPGAPCHLTVVPPRCHLPDDFSAGRRRFGIAAHLYTLRRAGEQGIGDFTTLAEFATAAAAQGAATVGLNPLHAMFPGAPDRASPYHPSDREFLDPIYIDVTALPGVAAAFVAESFVESFPIRTGPDMVDYKRVGGVKRWVLKAAFNAGGADDPAFNAFMAAGGETLRRFATFEAIAEVQRSTQWQRWPQELRHPEAPGVAGFAAAHADRVRFAGFLQFMADRQLATAARGSGLSLGLYRDLAVGAAPDGAEAWRRQDALLTGVSIGAPPDPFSAGGQVWSLPPPDPLAMALLAANMRHAGALRIDHAMGLQRLFLVPEGAAPSDGAYLAYPLQDLLGQLALESHRASCLVIGEDLGTVPEGLPAKLAATEVFSYRVLWFERDGSAFRPPARWPSRAAACVSTHDLPTLAGWWEAADIAERASLGLLDVAATQRALAERADDKVALLTLLRQEGLLDQAPDLDGPIVPVVVGAVHALIGVSPALLALVQAEDLVGEMVAVNLPGTDRERANWRRRLRTDIGHLFDGEAARGIMAAMRVRGGRSRQPS